MGLDDRRPLRQGEVWRTGDVVSEDEEGFLYFEGRNDDVIVSAGYRIGPFEVESALVSHAAVAEAAAVAAPDEERGAVVKAVVVLRDGMSPTPELMKELQEHCRARDGPVQVPAGGGVRGGAAEDGEREGQQSAAAGGLKSDDGVDLDHCPLGQLRDADGDARGRVSGEEGLRRPRSLRRRLPMSVM